MIRMNWEEKSLPFSKKEYISDRNYQHSSNCFSKHLKTQIGWRLCSSLHSAISFDNSGKAKKQKPIKNSRHQKCGDKAFVYLNSGKAKEER